MKTKEQLANEYREMVKREFTAIFYGALEVTYAQGKQDALRECLEYINDSKKFAQNWYEEKEVTKEHWQFIQGVIKGYDNILERFSPLMQQESRDE